MKSSSLCFQFAHTTLLDVVDFLAFSQQSPSLAHSMAEKNLFQWKYKIMKIGKIMFHIESKREHNERLCAVSYSTRVIIWTSELLRERGKTSGKNCFSSYIILPYSPQCHLFAFRMRNKLSLFIYLFRCVYMLQFFWWW